MKLIIATDSINHPLTGIGRYTAEICQGLQRYAESHSEIEDLKFYNLGRWQRSINTAFLKESSSKISVTRNASSLRARLAKNPLAVSAFKTIFPVISGAQLRRYGSDYIFHSPNQMLLPFAGKKLVTIHDLSILKFPHFHPPARVKLFRDMLKSSILKADHVITPSKSVRNEIIEEFAVSDERITAIYHGVSRGIQENADLSPSMVRLGVRRFSFFLFVGSIEPRKNLTNILDAYSKLSNEQKNKFPLLIVGNQGWNSGQIHNQIQALERLGEVRYLNHVPDEELRKLYANARALLYPSFYEGFGLPIIEAQSHGTPVISSNVSSMPEVLGDSGVTVDPYDVDSIRLALESLMGDEKFSALRSRSRENAAKFTWSKSLSETLDVYRTVNMS